MSDDATRSDPRDKHREEGFPPQRQDQPGDSDATLPTPDHGEDSYKGSARLEGRRALITGGDSGIGRAVAIAFAREGADVAIAHLPEEQDNADDTERLIEQAGRRG
ncbi:MAG TPA: SDR family NAD(P)-dependent oxidoreductase, partial [Microbacterium sp.]|nr:SDR family NAD(P)-dependent oxidoreductase [Microbacterium sp.]